MSWNRHPRYITTKIFKKLHSREWGQKTTIIKIKRTFYFCNKKDKILDYSKSHVVHEFCSPAYNASYIGKTDRNLGTWIKDHCWLDKDSLIFNHPAEWDLQQYTTTLHGFPCDVDVTLTNQDILERIRTTATNNVRIIGKAKIGLNFVFWIVRIVSGKSHY